MGRETVERGRRRSELERDVLSGLRNLGVTRADALAALNASSGETIEDRLRSALRALHDIYETRRPNRCREGACAVSTGWLLVDACGGESVGENAPRGVGRQLAGVLVVGGGVGEPG